MSNSARNCRNPAYPRHERRTILTDIEISQIHSVNVEFSTQLSKIGASTPRTSNSTHNCRKSVHPRYERRVLPTNIEISHIHSVNVEFLSQLSKFDINFKFLSKISMLSRAIAECDLSVQSQRRVSTLRPTDVVRCSSPST